MKKSILFGVGVLVLSLLLLGGGFLFLRSKLQPKQADMPEEEFVSKTIDQLPLSQRPFVSLTPRADGHEFTIEVLNVAGYESIEYELVYLAGGLSRGAIGTAKLEGRDSLERKVLLGSCSRGVCKYDEGVTGGTLTLRFRQGGEVVKYEEDFSLDQGEEELISPDEKFTLASSFPQTTFYTVIATAGLPRSLAQEIVAGPYGVYTSGDSRVSGAAKIMTDRLSQILVWDGSSWQELEDGQTPTLGVFVAVASSPPSP